MKESTKRLLRGVCVFALCVVIFAAVGTTARAETYAGSCGASVNWSLDTETGVLNITGSGEMKNNNVYAPWDSYTDSIKTVIIENGITNICKNAFYQCSNLTSVQIPNSVTEIGGSAFYQCYELTEVTFPSGLKTIGGDAFSGCIALTSIDLPDSVTEIGGSAFENCWGATTLKLPNGETEVGSCAFENCDALTSVTIPGKIKLGGGAFYGCSSLKNVVIMSGITEISDQCFSDCTSLQSITIPKTVTKICEWSFSGCEALTNITFPEGLEEIGSNAFYCCKSLTEIVIPLSVEKIGRSAFYGAGLTSATVYNADCEFVSGSYDSAFGKAGKVTVYGYDNSTAYEHAVKWGYAFKSLGKLMTFSDVTSDKYFYYPVTWAIREEITSGTGNGEFSPNLTCTTEQIFTFLWRAAGEPEPTIANPYTNVTGGEYYATAAIWAYEMGMINSTTLPVGEQCKRGSTVTYMWIYAGRPDSGTANFSDVSSDASYAKAVAWAVAAGVTNGTSATTFSPDTTCTRGQIVTFLYRAFA